MIKNICVFCSASDQLDTIYYESAEELGKLIGEKNFSLVYGAGATGLMGTVARNVYKHNGKIIGVIPKALDLDHIAHRDSDEFIVTNTLRERKEIMDQRSDAFIALPGGYGTLEELLEIITLKQLNYHDKPIIILNTNNFYSNLIEQFDKLIFQKFAQKEHAELYKILQTPIEAINYLLSLN